MTHDGPVLLIGGTRGTGLLIARLLDQKGYSVRALARTPEDAARSLPAGTEIVRGDITQPPTLAPALAGARHIVFTAGRRSGRPFGSRQIRQTEFEGVLNTLRAANRAGFQGRFLYMTASGGGGGVRSFWSFALNLYKGNTLKWRARTETLIRTSGLSYTIIRTGVLTNGEAGQRTIKVTQRALPLSPRHRIARGDVASVFVAALEHPRTARTTFEIVWDEGVTESWLTCLDHLEPDPPSPPSQKWAYSSEDA